MKTAIPRILVIGSAYVEVTLGVPRLPAGGETISEATLSVACGGRGLNQAVLGDVLGDVAALVAFSFSRPPCWCAWACTLRTKPPAGDGR